MTFGLTEQGLNIMTFPDIVDEMKDVLVEEFDNVQDIDLSEQSVNMQWINVMAKPQADFWEKIQEVYNSQSPANAEGVSLDDIAQYIGLQRLPAKPTLASVGIFGTGGTVIPEGTLITNTVNNQLFRFNADYAISSLITDPINFAYYQVTEVLNNETYLIDAEAGQIIYNSSANASLTEIINGLLSAANAISGITAIISEQNDTIIVDYEASSVVYGVTINMQRYDNAYVEAVETGPISAEVGTLTDIVNGITGFDGVYNFISGVLGNDVESDSAFKVRRLNSLSAIGAGTLPSMVARVLDDVPNVTLCSGFENRTKVVDAVGRPPSSFELLVDGGSNKDIGEKIWEIKPAGIEPYSRTGDFYDVVDSNGDTQRMFWSRPTDFPAYLNVVLTLNPEETFPSTGIDDIKNNLVEYGNSIEIGKNYIGDKFRCVIQQTQGVQSATLQFSKNGVDFFADNLDVDDFERGKWELARVNVV